MRQHAELEMDNRQSSLTKLDEHVSPAEDESVGSGPQSARRNEAPVLIPKDSALVGRDSDPYGLPEETGVIPLRLFSSPTSRIDSGYHSSTWLALVPKTVLGEHSTVDSSTPAVPVIASLSEPPRRYVPKHRSAENFPADSASPGSVTSSLSDIPRRRGRYIPKRRSGKNSPAGWAPPGSLTSSLSESPRRQGRYVPKHQSRNNSPTGWAPPNSLASSLSEISRRRGRYVPKIRSSAAAEHAPFPISSKPWLRRSHSDDETTNKLNSLPSSSVPQALIVREKGKLPTHFVSIELSYDTVC